MALQNFVLLGFGYIESCESLKKYETDFLLHEFGSIKCNYTEGKTLLG